MSDKEPTSAPLSDKTEASVSDKLAPRSHKRHGKHGKHSAPRFPVHYIKAQMKLLGCKKVTGTVPHMVAGILGAFSDEILDIANEAATAEVRIKKRKQGLTPRLSPNHMTFVKKHEDFRSLLSNVHFRNVWTSSTGQPDPPASAPDPEPNPDDILLACEKPAKKLTKRTFVLHSRDAESNSAASRHLAAAPRRSGAPVSASSAGPIRTKRLFQKTSDHGMRRSPATFLGKGMARMMTEAPTRPRASTASSSAAGLTGPPPPVEYF